MIKVGSFVKSVGAAPAAQSVAIDGGFKPTVVFLWTDGATAEAAFQASPRMAFGAASAAAEAGSVAQAVLDGATATAAGHTAGRVAAKALTIVNPDQTLAAECDLVSFDVDGFTLSWTTNDANATIIHFMAVQCAAAKVHNFQLRTTAGNQAVTGIGFKPDVYMLLGPVGGSATAIPSTVTHSYFAVGGAERAGGTQFGLGGNVIDTNTQRTGWLTATQLFHLEINGGVVEYDGAHVSMDADGYTFNVATNVTASAPRVVGVALLGLRAKVLSFAKGTGGAPASQAVTGAGFPPEGALLFSNQHGTLAANSAVQRGGIGGISSGAATAAVYAVDAAATVNADRYSRSDRAFTKVNNATPAVDAEASLTSMDADGFTLSWNPNDAVATRLIALALQATSPPSMTMQAAASQVLETAEADAGMEALPSGTGYHMIELELDGPGGGWTDVSDDALRDPEVSFDYGITGTGLRDRVASTGRLDFGLDNSENNSAGLKGLYSIGHANCRAGFRLGIGVRYSWGEPGSIRVYTKFVGSLDSADAISGAYGSRRTICAALDWFDDAAKKTAIVPTQVNKRADEALGLIVDEVRRQPVSRLFDVGDSTFPWSLDAERTVLAEMQRLVESELGKAAEIGGLGGGGVLRFWKRTAQLTPLPKAVLETTQDLSAPATREGVKNVVKVTTHPRRVGSTDTEVLFQLQSVPLVQPGETIEIIARYNDPAARASSVGGTDMRAPVATTDFLMNAAENGSGTDLTASFTVVSSGALGGGQSALLVTNNGGTAGYVTLLQLRGRGLYDYDPTDVVSRNEDSIEEVGENEVTIEMPYQEDQSVARAIAEFGVTGWTSPGAPEITVNFVAETAERRELGMSLEPGDAVTVREEMTAVNGVYFIHHVNGKVTREGLIIFDWAMQRALLADYWTLGVNDFSELGVTTVLAPL